MIPSPEHGTGVLASVIAEFVGSFYFVFCSCASTTLWPQYSNSPVLPVAVLSGLALAVVTLCSSGISNGFVNPVVTVAFYLTQRLCRLRFFLYVPAQILGGIAGAAFHYVTTPKQERDREAFTHFNEDLELIQGFVLEFTLAILFIFAIFTVLYGQRNRCENQVDAAYWKIGLIYTLCLMIDVPYTGGGLNPVWSLGSALVRNEWRSYNRMEHWVYWLAPILGGAFGGTLFEIWTTASELDDMEKYSHFKRMVALLVILVILTIVALVITLAL